MPDKCKKCDGDFSAPRDIFKCKECNGVFHHQCIGDTSKIKVGTRNTVRCENCIGETSSVGSRASETGSSAILEAIAALRSEMNERADQQLAKLNSVQATLDNAIKDIAVLKTKCDDLRVTSDSTVAQLVELKEQNVSLSKTIEILEREVADMQQHTRKGNVLISGVPVTAREDICSILISMAKTLDIDFHPSHVSAAHRLPAPLNSNRPSSIVVTFISRATKSSWIIARRRRKNLSAKEINPNFPDTQVFVNEHLTKDTRELFNAARNLVKARRLEAVWTSDCRILAKKTAAGFPFRIHSLHQINELHNLFQG